jgi:acetolactate synthase-1/2/3 large subunit
LSTVGIRLVELLEAYGVDTVFGIPGVHTIELYRGLAGSRLRHVTPRHEQAGGFMADGYARASGKVAACFVITGPGLTNVLTAMAQAYADSVPMLVVSSVNARADLGRGSGALHELRRQGVIAAECAAFSHTLLAPEELPGVLARAFAVFDGQRPRPVHIEIPLDVLALPCPPVERAPIRLARPRADRAEIKRAAALLDRARQPVILAGGGAVGAAEAVRNLAKQLDAPVVMTANARGLLGRSHPLSVPASPSLKTVRALIDASDAALAVGTEIGPTDYDMYGRAAFATTAPVVRIDIDPEQLVRGVTPAVALCGHAATTLAELGAALGSRPDLRDGALRAERARHAAWDEIGPVMRRRAEFLQAVRAAVPEATIVGDSTVAIYAGNLHFDAPAPRRWFNAATGYGALGFGLPAANGAAIATGRPTIALVGDGGLQFLLAELGTAAEERLPVVVLVWNNRGYGEIKEYMVEAGVEPVGVDLLTPDFTALARAYGLRAARPDSRTAIIAEIEAACSAATPALIEIDEAIAMGTAG